MTGKLYFAGRFGADAECMHWSAHQFAGCIINQAMAGNGVFAGKDVGDDVDMIVPAATPGAGMAGVQVRVVADGELSRIQCGKPLLQGVDGILAHAGKAFLNGLIVTFSYTPAAM